MSILPIESHIWVGASAGTGKTHTLIHRVLQLLLSGVSPSSILCLTYTNAAAAEMKSRIMTMLGDWVITDQASLTQTLSKIHEDVSEQTLKRARSLFFIVSERQDRLNIQTIHGFCQSILRRFPLEAGVSPYFTVMDEEQSKATIEQAFEQLLLEAHQGSHPVFGQAVQETILRLSDMKFREFIANAINDNARWRNFIEQAGGIKTCCQQLTEFLELAPEENVPGVTDAAKSALLQAATILASDKSKSAQALADSIHTFFHAPEITAASMETYKQPWLKQDGEIRDAIHKLANKYPEHGSNLLKEAQRIQQWHFQQLLQESYELNSHLYQVIASTFVRYEHLCQQQNLLDYHHLLQKTQQFFTRDEHTLGWVMFKLDGGIDHILVDEAQDTNPLQWHIIKALSAEYFSGAGRKEGNRTLFIVGDEKQSIFSFQDANVDYYRTIKQWLSAAARSAQQPFMETSHLLSYRSTPEVIHTVNQVVAHLNLGDAHMAHRNTAVGHVEIWPLVDAKEEEGKTILAAQALAADIASRIEQWLASGRMVAKTGAAIQPGDIMLLVRKRNEFSLQLASELRKRNIPVQGVERLVLKDNLAVKDILALMQWCLLDSDDMSLACVLRSPLCGISEEQLFTLCHPRGELTLWQHMQQVAGEQGLEDTLAFLQTCRQHMVELGVHAFIYTILFQYQTMRHFTRRMGQEVTIPLHALLEKARQFESAHPNQHQLFIETIRQQSHDMLARETIQNCVRIMTVHGAKGLQAPIVILADATETTRNPSGFEWLQTEDRKLPCWLLPKEEQSPALKNKIISTAALQESEDRRLLYVAITRAEDELYIAGRVRTRQNDDSSWYKTLEINH